jgi:hypothetical protein
MEEDFAKNIVLSVLGLLVLVWPRVHNGGRKSHVSCFSDL